MPNLKNTLNLKFYHFFLLPLKCCLLLSYCLHFDNEPPTPEELENQNPQTVSFRIQGMAQQNISIQYWKQHEPKNISFKNINKIDAFGFYQNVFLLPYNQPKFQMFILVDIDKNNSINNLDRGGIFEVNLNANHRQYLFQKSIQNLTTLNTISIQPSSNQKDGSYFCFFKPSNITGNVLPPYITNLSNWHPQVRFMIQNSTRSHHEPAYMPTGVTYKGSCIRDKNNNNIFTPEEDEIFPLTNDITLGSVVSF